MLKGTRPELNGVGDAIAIGMVVAASGSLAGWLPPTVAVVALVFSLSRGGTRDGPEVRSSWKASEARRFSLLFSQAPSG